MNISNRAYKSTPTARLMSKAQSLKVVNFKGIGHQSINHKNLQTIFSSAYQSINRLKQQL
jgi:hypothetical protein